VGDSERTASQYDAMAVEYTADNSDNATNAYYERPAMIDLLGDLEGSRVLDAGCGAGQLTEEMSERGAIVTAMDVSASMAELAHQRLGGRVTVLVADLAGPLTFAQDNEFDVVVASLVMHYIYDWVPVLREFRRVLARGGCVVFSTHHPTMDWPLFSPENYFATMQVTEEWEK
jgi:ubiquinone/menaquinone biosynthesis C-methylase UbiE